MAVASDVVVRALVIATIVLVAMSQRTFVPNGRYGKRAEIPIVVGEYHDCSHVIAHNGQLTNYPVTEWVELFTVMKLLRSLRGRAVSALIMVILDERRTGNASEEFGMRMQG